MPACLSSDDEMSDDDAGSVRESNNKLMKQFGVKEKRSVEAALLRARFADFSEDVLESRTYHLVHGFLACGEPMSSTQQQCSCSAINCAGSMECLRNLSNRTVEKILRCRQTALDQLLLCECKLYQRRITP